MRAETREKISRSKTQDVVARFMAKVEVLDDGCWRWLGRVDRLGYGQFDVGSRVDGRPKKSEKAHRMAYKLFVGELKPGHHVHHSCRRRWCVAPKHLEQMHADEHRAEPRACPRCGWKVGD